MGQNPQKVGQKWVLVSFEKFENGFGPFFVGFWPTFWKQNGPRKLAFLRVKLAKNRVLAHLPTNFYEKLYKVKSINI
jgi:hypothetical protein